MKHERGFIALISAVIISTILLGLATAAGMSTFSTRFNALNSEYKRVSLGLAESCIHAALLKIAENYNYVVPLGGEVVSIGGNTCTIKGPTTAPTENPLGSGKKIYNIVTQGQYKGAFSNLNVSALAQSPSQAPMIPPPTCALTVTPASIPQGQATTFGWNTAGSAVSFSIDHGVGSLAVPLGTQQYTPTASPGVITYTGTATNAGGSNTCTATLTITAPPPAPSCADTVAILDRTGSMSGTDLNNEETAADALVSLYQGVTPADPKVGVGSFGGLDGSAASIPANGILAAAYSNLLNAINTITNSNSSVGSDLGAAITVGTNELNSSRHVIDLSTGEYPKKVLVFVSDGLPNKPSGTTYLDTGFRSPTADVQDAGGELWSTPTNAYADGGGDATDPVSEDDQHRYYNFNFPTIPAGATIRGIEARLDAWATTTTMVATPASSQRAPSVTVAPNQWSTPTNAFTSNDVYATETTLNDAQGYSTFGFSIPSTATITGIQVTTEAKIVGYGASTQTGTLQPNGQGNDTAWNGDESDVDEGGAASCSSGDRIDSNNNGNRESVNIDLSTIPDGSNVTSIQVLTWDQGNSGGQYQDFISVNGTRTNSSTITVTSTSGCNSRTQNITTSFVKTGTSDVEVGVQKVGNTTVQVGAIRAVVTYQPPVTGSLAVALSSNNGGAWTASKTTTIDVNESVDAPTGNSATDKWDRGWVPADFNNGNFALRVTDTSSSGTVSLDQVLVTVNYTAPAPAAAACQIGMDVSWNGGATWTSEKQLSSTLTNTEATYTLGSATDDWTGSHTWVPSEFTNANFRARVHAIDPGSGCDNASVDHLDWLQARIHYSIAANPTQSALDAANLAKSAGGINTPDTLPVSIFSIHFGDSSGQNFMGQLASPSALPAATITTATRSGSTATITTSAPHKLVKNQRVVVSGVSGCSQFNGTFTITTVPTATSIRYTVPSSGCSSGNGGTVTPTNLFIAPNSSDMQGIFQSIGYQVCPAAAAACSNTSDDDSDGATDEFDPGCHTDGNASNLSSYDPADNDEWEAPATPVAPPPPPPPPSIDLGSWQETPTAP